jgi:ribosomal protein S18 acetylase RimI-like enzyme
MESGELSRDEFSAGALEEKLKLEGNASELIRRVFYFFRQHRSYSKKVVLELGGGNTELSWQIAMNNPDKLVIVTDSYAQKDNYKLINDLWNSRSLKAQKEPLPNLVVLKIKLKDMLQLLPGNSINSVLIVNPDFYTSRETVDLLNNPEIQGKLNGVKVFFKPYGNMLSYKYQSDLKFQEMGGDAVLLGGLRLVGSGKEVFGVNVFEHTQAPTGYSEPSHEKIIWEGNIIKGDSALEDRAMKISDLKNSAVFRKIKDEDSAQFVRQAGDGAMSAVKIMDDFHAIGDWESVWQQIQAINESETLGYYNPNQDTEKLMQNSLMQIEPNLKYALAVDISSNKVIGYVFFQRRRPDDKEVYVSNLAVLPEHQGQHIGIQLMRHVFEYANKLGHLSVTLITAWSAENPALAFYDKLPDNIPGVSIEGRTGFEGEIYYVFTYNPSVNFVMNARGGIDLTSTKMDLQTQNTGEGVKFHLDPAMLRQLQNASGFVPVIIDIQPIVDLRQFLGIQERFSVAAAPV